MLGSAIPRRWAFSIALVGLVTIFAVSYSAVWSSTAYADTQGEFGTGNTTLSPFSDSEQLDDVGTLPTGLNLSAGTQINVSAELFDATGAMNNNLDSSVTYHWTNVSGGVAVVAGSTARTAVLQANSSGTAKVRVEQVRNNKTVFFEREITITVVAPAPTSTPAPAPTNPGTPPSSIPNSQAVVAPESSSLVSSSGSETGSGAENTAFRDRAVIYIRSGSVSGFFGVQVNEVNPSSLPPLPSNFNLGSSAVDIVFVDDNGNAQQSFRLLRSAQVCLPTNSSDLANGFANVVVLRLDSNTNQWVPLTTTYNHITGQACASSSVYSNFAVGVQQIPATPGPGDSGLPATGGWSPTNGMLALIGLLGVAFAGAGFVTLRRAKVASRPE